MNQNEYEKYYHSTHHSSFVAMAIDTHHSIIRSFVARTTATLEENTCQSSYKE